jgi:hypothetical protein
VHFRVTGTIDKPIVTEIKKTSTESPMHGPDAPAQQFVTQIKNEGVELPSGAPAPAPQDETRILVRISKQFIEDVAAREEIAATVPYYAKALGFRSQGVAHGSGHLSIEMLTAQGEATFVVHSHGAGEAYARATRGPIVVTGQATVPFTAQTVVRFDGRKFYVVDTTPSAQVHFQLDRIETRRGGPVGRALGRLARPIGVRLVPRAEAQARPYGEYYLKNFVDGLAGEIVEKLDRTTPVEKSVNRLFPETRDWVFQMSTDAQFLQAAYGPRGSTAPTLPENPARLKDVRLELWLHSSATEAQDLVKLRKEPLAKRLVQRYLETELPELAALAENRSLDAVGPWLVISVGAPKAN